MKSAEVLDAGAAYDTGYLGCGQRKPTVLREKTRGWCASAFFQAPVRAL
jgi:hypothetical protein